MMERSILVTSENILELFAIVPVELVEKKPIFQTW